MILSRVTLIVDGKLLVLPPPVLTPGEPLRAFRCPKGHVFLPSCYAGVKETTEPGGWRGTFGNPVDMPAFVPCWLCRGPTSTGA